MCASCQDARADSFDPCQGTDETAPTASTFGAFQSIGDGGDDSDALALAERSLEPADTSEDWSESERPSMGTGDADAPRLYTPDAPRDGETFEEYSARHLAAFEEGGYDDVAPPPNADELPTDAEIGALLALLFGSGGPMDAAEIDEDAEGDVA